MPKLFLRIVASLLALCLIADPVTASAFTNPLSLGRGRAPWATGVRGDTQTRNLFQQEAIIPTIVNAYRSLTSKPSAHSNEVQIVKTIAFSAAALATQLASTERADTQARSAPATAPDRAVEEAWILQKYPAYFEVNPVTHRIRYGASFQPKPLSFDLYLGRHGVTDANLKQRYQGTIDGPENHINETGRHQALQFAEALFQHWKNDFEANGAQNLAVVSSPAARAQETAAIFVELVLDRTGILLPVEVIPDAHEIAFGPWEGKSLADIEASDPSEVEIIKRYRSGDVTVKGRPGGESFLDALARGDRVLDRLNQSYAGKKVALFGHGAFGRAIRTLTGDPSLVFDSGEWISHVANRASNTAPHVIPRIASETGSGAAAPEKTAWLDSFFVKELVNTFRLPVGIVVGLFVASKVSVFQSSFSTWDRSSYGLVAQLVAIGLTFLTHELGHYIFGRYSNAPIELISGVRHYLRVGFTRKQQIWVALGGPLSNLFLAVVIGILFPNFSSPFFQTGLRNFAYWNLVVGLGALLPLSPFAGGGLILRLLFKPTVKVESAAAPVVKTVFPEERRVEDIRPRESIQRLRILQELLHTDTHPDIRGIIVAGSVAANKEHPSDLDTMLVLETPDSFLAQNESAENFYRRAMRQLSGIDIHPLLPLTINEDHPEFTQVQIALHFIPPHLNEDIKVAYDWRTPGASLIRDYIILGKTSQDIVRIRRVLKETMQTILRGPSPPAAAPESPTQAKPITEIPERVIRGMRSMLKSYEWYLEEASKSGHLSSDARHIFENEIALRTAILDGLHGATPVHEFIAHIAAGQRRSIAFRWPQFEEIWQQLLVRNPELQKQNARTSLTVSQQLSAILEDPEARRAWGTIITRPVATTEPDRYIVEDHVLKDLLAKANIQEPLILDRGASTRVTSYELQRRVRGRVIAADLQENPTVFVNPLMLAHNLTKQPTPPLSEKVEFRQADVTRQFFEDLKGKLAVIRDGSLLLHLSPEGQRQVIGDAFRYAEGRPEGLFYHLTHGSVTKPGLFGQFIFHISGQKPAEWQLEHVGILAQSAGTDRSSLLTGEELYQKEKSVSDKAIQAREALLKLARKSVANKSIFDEYGRIDTETRQHVVQQLSAGNELSEENEILGHMADDIMLISPWTFEDEYLGGYYEDHHVLGSQELAWNFTPSKYDVEALLSKLAHLANDRGANDSDSLAARAKQIAQGDITAIRAAHSRPLHERFMQLGANWFNHNLDVWLKMYPSSQSSLRERVSGHLRLAQRMGIFAIGWPVFVLSVHWIGRQFVLPGTVQDFDRLASAVEAQEKRGESAIIVLAGEDARDAAEADAFVQNYVTLAQKSQARWGDSGLKRQLAIKLSALYPNFDHHIDQVVPRVAIIAKACKDAGLALTIDGEFFDQRTAQIAVFEEVREQPELRGWEGLGLVVQSYFKDSESVIDQLLHKAAERKFGIRLVKGAYYEQERQAGHPVWSGDTDAESQVRVDQAYRELTTKLLHNTALVYPMIASMNPREQTWAYVVAKDINLPSTAWESQMLYGMQPHLGERLVQRGQALRRYMLFGDVVSAMKYFARRRPEITGPTSISRRVYDSRVSVQSLVDMEAAAPEKNEADRRLEKFVATITQAFPENSALQAALTQMQSHVATLSLEEQLILLVKNPLSASEIEWIPLDIEKLQPESLLAQINYWIENSSRSLEEYRLAPNVPGTTIKVIEKEGGVSPNALKLLDDVFEYIQKIDVGLYGKIIENTRMISLEEGLPERALASAVPMGITRLKWPHPWRFLRLVMVLIEENDHHLAHQLPLRALENSEYMFPSEFRVKGYLPDPTTYLVEARASLDQLEFLLRVMNRTRNAEDKQEAQRLSEQENAFLQNFLKGLDAIQGQGTLTETGEAWLQSIQSRYAAYAEIVHASPLAEPATPKDEIAQANKLLDDLHALLITKQPIADISVAADDLVQRVSWILSNLKSDVTDPELREEVEALDARYAYLNGTLNKRLEAAGILVHQPISPPAAALARQPVSTAGAETHAPVAPEDTIPPGPERTGAAIRNSRAFAGDPPEIVNAIGLLKSIRQSADKLYHAAMFIQKQKWIPANEQKISRTCSADLENIRFNRVPETIRDWEDPYGRLDKKEAIARAWGEFGTVMQSGRRVLENAPAMQRTLNKIAVSDGRVAYQEALKNITINLEAARVYFRKRPEQDMRIFDLSKALKPIDFGSGAAATIVPQFETASPLMIRANPDLLQAALTQIETAMMSLGSGGNGQLPPIHINANGLSLLIWMSAAQAFPKSLNRIDLLDDRDAYENTDSIIAGREHLVFATRAIRKMGGILKIYKDPATDFGGFLVVFPLIKQSMPSSASQPAAMPKTGDSDVFNAIPPKQNELEGKSLENYVRWWAPLKETVIYVWLGFLLPSIILASAVNFILIRFGLFPQTFFGASLLVTASVLGPGFLFKRMSSEMFRNSHKSVLRVVLGAIKKVGSTDVNPEEWKQIQSHLKERGKDYASYLALSLVSGSIIRLLILMLLSAKLRGADIYGISISVPAISFIQSVIPLIFGLLFPLAQHVGNTRNTFKKMTEGDIFAAQPPNPAAAPGALLIALAEQLEKGIQNTADLARAIRPYLILETGPTASEAARCESTILDAIQRSLNSVADQSHRSAIAKSIALSLFIHKGQTRMIANRPYAFHLANAVLHFLNNLKETEHISDQEEISVIISTIWLHDTVEDVLEGAWGKSIRATFGERSPREETRQLIQHWVGEIIKTHVDSLSEESDEPLSSYFLRVAKADKITQIAKFCDLAANRDELIDPKNPNTTTMLYDYGFDEALLFLDHAQMESDSKIWLLKHFYERGQEANLFFKQMVGESGQSSLSYIAMAPHHEIALRTALKRFQTENPGQLTSIEKTLLQPKYETITAFLERYPAWRKEYPKAKLLFLVRHPQSTSNLFEYIQDYETFSPLTLRGMQQRDAFTEFMAHSSLPIDRIVSSDLERPMELVRKLANRYGMKAEILKRFREVRIQPIGGISKEQAKRLFPNNLENFTMDPGEFAIWPYFSVKKLRKYIDRFIQELIHASNCNILVGSHGMTILIVVMDLLRIPSEKYGAMFRMLGNPPNVGITALTFYPEQNKWELLVYGDDSYLPQSLKGWTKNPAEMWLNRIAFYGRAAMRVVLWPLNTLLLRQLPADYYPNSRLFIEPSDEWVLERIKQSGKDSAAAAPNSGGSPLSKSRHITTWFKSVVEPNMIRFAETSRHGSLKSETVRAWIQKEVLPLSPDFDIPFLLDEPRFMTHEELGILFADIVLQILAPMGIMVPPPFVHEILSERAFGILTPAGHKITIYEFEPLKDAPEGAAYYDYVLLSTAITKKMAELYHLSKRAGKKVLRIENMADYLTNRVLQKITNKQEAESFALDAVLSEEVSHVDAHRYVQARLGRPMNPLRPKDPEKGVLLILRPGTAWAVHLQELATVNPREARNEAQSLWEVEAKLNALILAECPALKMLEFFQPESNLDEGWYIRSRNIAKQLLAQQLLGTNLPTPGQWRDYFDKHLEQLSDLNDRLRSAASAAYHEVYLSAEERAAQIRMVEHPGPVVYATSNFGKPDFFKHSRGPESRGFENRSSLLDSGLHADSGDEFDGGASKNVEPAAAPAVSAATDVGPLIIRSGSLAQSLWLFINEVITDDYSYVTTAQFKTLLSQKGLRPTIAQTHLPALRYLGILTGIRRTSGKTLIYRLNPDVRQRLRNDSNLLNRLLHTPALQSSSLKSDELKRIENSVSEIRNVLALPNLTAGNTLNKRSARRFVIELRDNPELNKNERLWKFTGGLRHPRLAGVRYFEGGNWGFSLEAFDDDVLFVSQWAYSDAMNRFTVQFEESSVTLALRKSNQWPTFNGEKLFRGIRKTKEGRIAAIQVSPECLKWLEKEMRQGNWHQPHAFPIPFETDESANLPVHIATSLQDKKPTVKFEAVEEATGNPTKIRPVFDYGIEFFQTSTGIFLRLPTGEIWRVIGTRGDLTLVTFDFPRDKSDFMIGVVTDRGEFYASAPTAVLERFRIERAEKSRIAGLLAKTSQDVKSILSGLRTALSKELRYFYTLDEHFNSEAYKNISRSEYTAYLSEFVEDSVRRLLVLNSVAAMLQQSGEIVKHNYQHLAGAIQSLKAVLEADVLKTPAAAPASQPKHLQLESRAA